MKTDFQLRIWINFLFLPVTFWTVMRICLHILSRGFTVPGDALSSVFFVAAIRVWDTNQGLGLQKIWLPKLKRLIKSIRPAIFTSVMIYFSLTKKGPKNFAGF